jgi:hypothetical protein
MAATGKYGKKSLDLGLVRRLYVEQELSLGEVAVQVGCSIPTLRKNMLAAEIPLRPRGHKTDAHREAIARAKSIDPDPERLRQWREQGWSCQDMADELGCSDEVVRRAMVRADIARLEAKARPHRNTFWNGGLHVDKHGYILQKVPHHPYGNNNGYVRQHRLVMESMLGRLLDPDEVVDHVNGDTSDNRPENLRLFATNAEHLRVTMTGSKNLDPKRREQLRRQSVQRATDRVDAIRQASGTDVGPCPLPDDHPLARDTDPPRP